MEDVEMKDVPVTNDGNSSDSAELASVAEETEVRSLEEEQEFATTSLDNQEVEKNPEELQAAKEKESQELLKRQKALRQKELQRKKRRNLLENKAAQKAYQGRLIITHMELENFKSYAGVVRIGPFHKCFSAIIGPNGSGKSNVIDAMLFVFGKRAKKLRLKKVSQLIHKSAEHPNCDSARVTVYFQNIIDLSDAADRSNNAFQVVPNTALAVTRIAYASNKSEYYVKTGDGDAYHDARFTNDRKATFTEIYNLLVQRGVDLHQNRFLILQGEVEQISLMKPKRQHENDEEGLLEYLEDIIGTNKYVDAVEDLEAKVEEVNTERVEKMNVIRVVEKDMEKLEKSKNEALKYMERERGVLFYRNRSFNLQLSKLGRGISAIDTEVEALRKEKDAIRASQTQDVSTKGAAQPATKNQVKEMEVELKKMAKESSKLASEMTKQEKEVVAFERTEVKYDEDLKHITSSIKTVESNLKKEHQKVDKFTEKVSQDEGSIEELEADVRIAREKKQAEESELESMFSALKDETDPLRTGLEEKQRLLAPLAEAKNAHQNTVELLDTELSLLEKGVSETKETLQKAKAEQVNLETKKDLYPKEIKQLEAQKEEFTTERSANQEKLDEKLSLIKRLESKIESKRIHIEAAKEKLESTSSNSCNELSARLLKAQATGRKGGETDFTLIGRAGDLATIDKKYDVAISTACGSLNFLVAETTEGAEKCIKYLRKHNLGRASFAVLDKLQYLHSRVSTAALKFNPPKSSERLFDVISWSEAKPPKHCQLSPQAYVQGIKSVFYLGLKDTLVVSDLDLAVKIAYAKNGKQTRPRVVTTQGQLIESSGAMSGGGRKVLTGLMRLSQDSLHHAASTDFSAHQSMEEEADEEQSSGFWDAEEIKLQEAKLLDYEDKLKKVRLRKQELQTAITQLTSQISVADQQISRLSNELANLASQLQQIQHRIQALTPKLELSKEQKEVKEELEGKKEAAQSMLNKVREESASLEADCEVLEEKIANAGGLKLKEQKACVQECSEQVEAASTKLKKTKLEIQDLQKKMQKAEAKIKDLEAELSTFKKNKEAMETDFQVAEGEAEKVKQTMEDLRAAHAEKSLQLKEKRAALEELRQTLNELERKFVSIDNKMEDLETEKRKQSEKQQVYMAKKKEINTEFGRFLPDYLIVSQTQEGDENREDTPESKEEEGVTGDEADDSDAQQTDRVIDLEDKFDKFTLLESENGAPEDESEIESLLEEVREELQEKEADLKQVKKELGSNLNLNTIADYFTKEQDYEKKVEVLNEVTYRRDQVKTELEGIKKKRLSEFMYAFQDIALNLKMLYQMLTLGGDADLDLVDSLDPFSEGITFSVRPPKKSWKNIRNLSGGEKTLSSLALVFALHKYERNALYVMDEIDAALDFRNVSIVGNYIKERTKDAQFVIISLRNNMFELSDRLVGIYKTNNATKSITICPYKIVQKQQEKLEEQQAGNSITSTQGKAFNTKTSEAAKEAQTVSGNDILKDRTNRIVEP